MDKFSFLNSAHTSFFAEMYDQYLESPDSLEPSWKAFFQGFDFGLESANITVEEKTFAVPENIKKEFQVINLIDAYRKRGHLFTLTNPVRERRKHKPSLDYKNFGFQESDLELSEKCDDFDDTYDLQWQKDAACIVKMINYINKFFICQS